MKFWLIVHISDEISYQIIGFLNKLINFYKNYLKIFNILKKKIQLCSSWDIDDILMFFKSQFKLN